MGAGTDATRSQLGVLSSIVQDCGNELCYHLVNSGDAGILARRAAAVGGGEGRGTLLQVPELYGQVCSVTYGLTMVCSHPGWLRRWRGCRWSWCNRRSYSCPCDDPRFLNLCIRARSRGEGIFTTCPNKDRTKASSALRNLNK